MVTYYLWGMDLQTIGQQIKDARKAAGLTQTQLAEMVGNKKGNISRIEAGDQNICFNTLQAIAKALEKNLPERWLL